MPSLRFAWADDDVTSAELKVGGGQIILCIQYYKDALLQVSHRELADLWFHSD